MKCPMCLGKGYATDEDIKEYPHRCQNCDGKWFYSVDWQKVRCEVCDGSGKKPMTNEEWFNGLATEEKAKRIINIAVNSDCDYRTIVEWLKQPHNGE